MRALEVRDLLLARSIEEADTEGELVGPEERRRITREARGGTEGEPALLTRRARLVLAQLEGHEPALARAQRATDATGPPLWTVVLVALVLGALYDRIGGGRRVHVLAFPVVGLLAWNLVVYALLGTASWRRWKRRRARRGRDGWLEWEARRGSPPLVRLFAWLGDPTRPGLVRRLLAGGARGRLWGTALARFFSDWLACSAPLQELRLRRALHAGACAFAVGVIASLYLRGLVFAYEASWESTFLSPEGASTILAVVLAPAALLLGLEVSDAEHLAAIRDTPESAARWIHLWAANVALLVVLPRAVLSLLAHRRAQRLEEELPFDWESDPYALRLLAPERGGGASALVVPYSYRLSARARERLVELLLDLLGNRATVRVGEPIDYGDTPGGALPDGCQVLVFNLAQSPEQEVHGRLVEALRRGVEGAAGNAALLVCIDESPYVARLGSDVEAEQRVEERRRSWRRVLREAGVRGVFLRLDATVPDEGLEAARGGLYPERAGAAIR